MRRQAESDGDAPRKLGAPELKARREEVIAKMHGLTITQGLDVSDQLLTECVSMYDRNRLKYLPWEACAARSLEVVGIKQDATWCIGPRTGYLKCEQGASQSDPADCGSEILLDMALKRRGLALAMADLLDWTSTRS